MGKVKVEAKVTKSYPNWLENHFREKEALNDINHLKISIIPAFVALAQVYKIEVESLSKKIRMQDQTQLERYKNILKQALNSFDAPEYQQEIKGINNKLDFKTDKWSTIFEECEICALAILQSVINYLEQSSTIGENEEEVEYETCHYFFMNAIDEALRSFFHQTRRVNWLQYVENLDYISPFGYLKWSAKRLVTFVDNIWPINASYLKALKTACLDLVEAQIEQERQLRHDGYCQDLITENRCYGVLDAARKLVTLFITRCLHSLTATLFHYCVSKFSLTVRDRVDLEECKIIIKSVEEDVNAAANMFTLISEGKMRPYGFIMKATLDDSLPKDKVKANTSKEIRLNLLECTSIFMNWRFDFVSRYPRPIQAQFSRLSKVSNLFQSVIESADDFIVILKVAKRLCETVEQRLKEGKIPEGTTGPWCLLAELEKYFHCQRLEYEVKTRNKALPAQIQIIPVKGSVQ